MNLRILKKLSKRAALLLPLLGDCRDQFPAGKDDSDTSIGGCDRKHWERLSVSHGEKPWRGIKFKVKRAERWVVMYPPTSPLKGTVMVGEMSGYYEPEWSEQTAWEALRAAVFEDCTDWTEHGFTITRDLSTTRHVLAAARELANKATLDSQSTPRIR